MDAAGQIPQLLQRQLHLAVCLVDHRRRRVRILQQLLLRQAEPHGEGDEPGLRAVVQIAFDTPQVGRRGIGDRHPVDSSSAIRCSSSSDGESSPRAIARSTFDSQRATQGSAGHPTKSDTKATVKVRTAPGAGRTEQRMPPGHRILQTRPQPREESPPARPQRTRLLHPQPEQRPCPRPLQLSVVPARHQPRGQQGQPDHGDGQGQPQGQPHHDHHERGDTQREVGQQVRDLPPGPGAERALGDGGETPSRVPPRSPLGRRRGRRRGRGRGLHQERHRQHEHHEHHGHHERGRAGICPSWGPACPAAGPGAMGYAGLRGWGLPYPGQRSVRGVAGTCPGRASATGQQGEIGRRSGGIRRRPAGGRGSPRRRRRRVGCCRRPVSCCARDGEGEGMARDDGSRVGESGSARRSPGEEPAVSRCRQDRERFAYSRSESGWR